MSFALMIAAMTLAGPDLHQVTQAADIEMLKCFYGQATVLDDHVSDASTIARAVVSACHPQFDDWKFANYAELQPLGATQFYTNLERGVANIALEIVLKMRSQNARGR